MAKRKIEIFIEIKTEKEFETVLNQYADRLICAEIYCDFAGSCTALDRLFTKIKMEYSDGQMILLKVLADNIEVMKRFRNHSEPVFLFIVNKKIIKTFHGVDSRRIEDVAKKEIYYFNKEKEGACFDRQLYELDEPTPDEKEWQELITEEKRLETSIYLAQQEARQTARKQHRAERMVPYLQDLNFVLFWPQAKHAHPELYERWDENNIVMVSREELQLTKEKALDILYAGDAPLNEASFHALVSGPALAICFRSLDSVDNFVSLVRNILYEETKSCPDLTKTRTTAFDYYKSYSPSKEQIWQQRHEDRMKYKEELREKRARRLSEMQRLARLAIEEAKEAKRAAREQHKMELLKKGKLDELDDISEDDEVDIVYPEALSEASEEEVSEEEDVDEYFPPAGLLVPGFYAPPNDVAKANGLAILFPKLVHEKVTPQPEFLPPHVLVLIHMDKRYKAIEAMAEHKNAIIHMGVFKATTPEDAVHIAYSVKQYDRMGSVFKIDDLKLAFMISMQKDLPLLELMDLNPLHVSRDSYCGEIECAAMFKIGYGDDYPQLEDFGEIEEEEVTY